MRGWAPQKNVQLKCIMNDNKMDSLHFQYPSSWYQSTFFNNFLDYLNWQCPWRRHSGTALCFCINIIVDWEVAYMCILLTHTNSKLAFFSFTQFINFRPNEPIRFSSLYSWKSIKQLAILVTPLRPRTTWSSFRNYFKLRLQTLCHFYTDHLSRK